MENNQYASYITLEIIFYRILQDGNFCSAVHVTFRKIGVNSYLSYSNMPCKALEEIAFKIVICLLIMSGSFFAKIIGE